MDTKKEYIAPELTVVSFKTERGYAASQPLSQLVNALTSVFNAYGIQTWDGEVVVENDPGWTDWS